MRSGPRRGGAVLGSPIAHSLSPVVHATAYSGLGLDGWTFGAVEATEGSLREVLTRLDDAGLAGVALTMPLKRAVLPLLARCERLAADVGAVNTVCFGGIEGEWWGANTDVPGMVAALRASGHPVPLGDAPTVLGAGATAAAAIAALAELGSREVTVAARRVEAVDQLRVGAARFGVDLLAVPLDGISLPPDGLVVSTLPAGAADRVVALLPARIGGLLHDVVYDGWPTALATAWSAAGGAVVGGLELLVGQAVLQVELMTGRRPDAEPMRAAGLAALEPGGDAGSGQIH